mgnify:CR=1 FL=1
MAPARLAFLRGQRAPTHTISIFISEMEKRMAHWRTASLSGNGFTLDGAPADYAPDLALEPIHLEIRLELTFPQQLRGGL